MKKLNCILLILLGLSGFVFSSEISSYDIAVAVNPSGNYLEAVAGITIQGGENPVHKIRIFLHEEFEVESITRGNTSLDFSVLSRNEDRMMYSPSGVPVDIQLNEPLDAGKSFVVDIRYSGLISSVINNVNMISDHLVEIALYSSWYPLMKGSRAFTYSVQITLPSDFLCVTDGELIEKETEEGRSTWWFKRDDQGMDIPVIASDQLTMKQLDTPEMNASIYFKEMDDGLAEQELENVIGCVRFFKHILGQPVRQGKLIYVNSPRGGWGYSRVPLFVVSEEYAESQLKSPDGKIRRYHGQAHEIGHFWWMLTDSMTANNWIDEALAEFFALQAVEKVFGEDRTRDILKKYQNDIIRIKEAKPILETIRSDQTAYVLFYEKGAMIFRMLREMLGEERLYQTLRKFYSSQLGKGEATTADLLGTFRKETGLNLDSFFHQFLKSNTLPSLESTWEGDGHGGVTGSINLNQASFERFPIEITFIRMHKRTFEILPGENRFEFKLPFNPDLILLDQDYKLLVEKNTVIKKK